MTEQVHNLEAQIDQLREELKTCKRQLKEFVHANPSSHLSTSCVNVFHTLALQFGSDLCFQLDEKGNIAQLSSSAVGYLGLPIDQAIGTSFEQLLRETDRPRWRDYRSTISTSTRITPLVLAFATGRNKPVEVEVRCLPLREGRGRVQGWIGLGRHVSPREVGDQQLLIAEVKLAAGLAHELNQPLTSIGTTARACARLIRSEQSDPQELVQAIDQISRQAERAGEIIRRLRDLMMQGKRHRARIDLNELIRESLQLLSTDLKAANVKLKVELAPDLPTIVVDQVQIGQVMVNLARNALESMQQAPKVHRVLKISTRCQPTEVIVEISDHGSGLSVSVIDRLFEPFTTTKPQGMGMGLALSRNIIQAHHGRLWAKPNADRGTIFSFSLPLTDEKV